MQVDSLLPAELHVRHPNCDAIASWSIEPGTYEVSIRDGMATLTTPDAVEPGPELPIGETCIFSGP